MFLTAPSQKKRKKKEERRKKESRGMNQAGVEWSGEKWNVEDREEWRKKPVQKIVALTLQSICQLVSLGQDTSSFLFPNVFFPVCFVLFNSVPFLLFIHVPTGVIRFRVPYPTRISFNQRGAQQQKFEIFDFYISYDLNLLS